MRALSVMQPWASLIVLPGSIGKDIENRSAPPPAAAVGHTIAIHASQRWDGKGAEWLRTAPRFSDLPPELLEPSNLPRGVIVGAARLDGWARAGTASTAEPLGPGLTVADILESRWFTGPVGWALRRRERLEHPLPARGQLGLWTVPAQVEKELMRGLGWRTLGLRREWREEREDIRGHFDLPDRGAAFRAELDAHRDTVTKAMGIPRHVLDLSAGPPARCRSCGAGIIWLTLDTGKRMPVDFAPPGPPARGNVELLPGERWLRPWLREVEELMAGPERLARADAVARVREKMVAYIEEIEERAAIREADGESPGREPPRPPVAQQMREWKRERDKRRGIFTFADGSSPG